ncbi:MAG: hypothetical protein PQJ61_16390 [Spirochaetales bacterium]|uniref:Uncharacterized protein n=1 Tax=Candidatus Thalassospirochaeta sargassi TaxID=3119039 RepID=A0AAJ1IFE8_9SPIO|nr:hypothetical protein [Spirochaetales bacterium]
MLKNNIQILVVAGVRGAEFFMSYGRTIDESPDIRLCVNEGSVEVNVPATGDSVLVREREGISILDGENLTVPEFYPWTGELYNLDTGSFDLSLGFILKPRSKRAQQIIAIRKLTASQNI